MRLSTLESCRKALKSSIHDAHNSGDYRTKDDVPELELALAEVELEIKFAQRQGR